MSFSVILFCTIDFTKILLLLVLFYCDILINVNFNIFKLCYSFLRKYFNSFSLKDMFIFPNLLLGKFALASDVQRSHVCHMLSHMLSHMTSIDPCTRLLNMTPFL